MSRVAPDAAGETLELRERQLKELVRSNAGPGVYDEWCRALESLDKLDTDGCVAFLAEVAGAGPVLELAIGTGRVAIPLARRGFEVHGIDAEAKMVEELHAKPGGADIPVTVGDLTDVPVRGTFGLIFIVFNTLFGLPSLDDQRRCVAAVARHLTPDGAFVVEVPHAAVRRLEASEERSVKKVELGGMMHVDVGIHDAASQRVEHEHILIGPDGIQVSRSTNCYVSVGQLDEMAAACGLRLEERWGGWRRQPLEDDSKDVISVYRRRVNSSAV
jgi:SAM-dependent methyltransferase